MLRTRSPRFHTASRPVCTRTAAAALGILAIAIPALAQESRHDLLEAERARKATQLRPYEPDGLERSLLTVDSVLRLMTTGTVYPFLGSAFEGGGLTVGPGYRGWFGDAGRFDVRTGWSFKNYRMADATLALPSFAGGRLQLELRANWVDAPDVAFFGTGNDTRRDDRAGFAYGATTVGVTMRVQAAKSFAAGVGVDSIETETVPSAGAAALPASPSYRRARLFAEFDTRSSPGYTRRGALYRAEWSDYAQTNAGPYSFRRFDAEARQFLPFMRENWVVALRALASSTTTASDGEVPYFMMPELGGSSWLRGYPSWRFRDRNRLLLSGEYRWTAGSFVDMALFMDAGKVSSRLSTLGSEAFRHSYGIGMSLHAPASTVARLELARTSEGTALVLSFGPSF
jgi:hypothetical protein